MKAGRVVFILGVFITLVGIALVISGIEWGTQYVWDYHQYRQVAVGLSDAGRAGVVWSSLGFS